MMGKDQIREVKARRRRGFVCSSLFAAKLLSDSSFPDSRIIRRAFDRSI